MRKSIILSLLVMLALTLAACGGGAATPTNTGETGGTDTTTEEAPEAVEPADVTVVGLDIKYEPAEVTVKAGQPVNLTLDNQGALEHNLTWDENTELFLTTMAGESATGEITFDTAGTYGFHCTVAGHKEAGMVGTITVE